MPRRDDDTGVHELAKIEARRERKSALSEIRDLRATPMPPIMAVQYVDEEVAGVIPGEGRPLVLIVDDDELMRRAWKHRLDRIADVWTAANVEAARVAIQTAATDIRRIRCVVLDHSLPNGDGLAVLRYLRASPEGRDVKVHVVSAHLDHEGALQARYADANGGGPITYDRKGDDNGQSVIDTITRA